MTIGNKVLNGKYEVIGIRHIANYGKYFTNEKIAAEICVKGKRGATYNGYIYTDGKVEVLNMFSSTTPKFIGELLYDAETGTTINPVAVC